MNSLHEVLHKRLQRDVVGEDGLGGLGSDTAVCPRRVRRRRVQLGEQETSLGSAGIADNEAREGEAIRDEFL